MSCFRGAGLVYIIGAHYLLHLGRFYGSLSAVSKGPVLTRRVPFKTAESLAKERTEPNRDREINTFCGEIHPAGTLKALPN